MTATLSPILSDHGHRLLKVGAALVLYSFFEGFAILYLGSPRIGLSVHTLSAFQGVLLLVLGLVWPRLALGPTSARLAFWFLVYSTFAILAAYTIAAVWGVGIETIRLMGELPDGAKARLVTAFWWRAGRGWGWANRIVYLPKSP